MDEVFAFLKDAGTFFIATNDGGQPRVRPFGFVMKYQNRLYFCSGTMKPFYEQMNADPRFEISACNAKGEWLRLSGKGRFVDDLEAKKQAFAEAPGVAALYQDPASPNFALFCIEDAAAQFCSFTSSPRTVTF